MNDTNRCGCAARGYSGYDQRMYMHVPSISPLPANPVVGMAYVPMQISLDMYPLAKAYDVGTLFPVLDKPFLGGCAK